MSETQGQVEAYDPRPWEKERARRSRAWGVRALGPQGKLVLCFAIMTCAALGSACWLFAKHTREHLERVGGEQARQFSMMLAMACEDELREGGRLALQQLAEDLINSRNILFVSFLDNSGKALVLASRDDDLRVEQLQASAKQAHKLSQARPMRSAAFGDYVEAITPVYSKHADASGTASSELHGYVAVGVSQALEIAQLNRINLLVIGIGCVAVVMSIPLTYMLVRRIFVPIHELVRVTRRISAGDLDARVSTQRSDVIGDLAKSFNEMVIWVKKQQQDIEAANKQLAEANRDLEAKVEQRTSQVETALKRLSAEIAEKEDFLRAVSHDLNAPLRNISGMATMLLMKHRDKFDEDVVHRLERIKKNVDVETDLIAELLELSRIKTRRQKMEPVNLETLIWELRGLFENDLKSKAIELVVDSALPILHAERARVRQVFQNLIDNAIKYMGEGMTRQIHIGCTTHAAEAEFYVRDTGMGIDPEDIDKVFFVFRRGKNTGAQNIAGKGVGLASVKSIIETYNGKIWVESQLGQGTTFRFTINGKHVPAISHESIPVETAQEAEPATAGVA